MSVRRPGPLSTSRAVLGAALRELRAHGWILVTVAIASQLIVFLVAVPLIRWLTRMALVSSGSLAFTLDSAPTLLRTPTSIALLTTVALVALAAVSLQLLVLVVLTRVLQREGTASPREVLAEFGAAARRLATPDILLFLGYLFVILPLGGLGVASVVIQGVAIPAFVSGELVKSDLGTIVYIAFVLAIGYLNVRLLLVLPAFAAGRGPAASLATSWRLTRQQTPATVLALAAIGVGGVLASAALVALCLAPTMVTDAIAPNVSPVVAGISLAIAQVAGLVLTSVVTVVTESAALALHDRRVAESADADAATAAHEPIRRPVGARHVAVGVVVGLVAITGLAVLDVPVLRAMHVQPDTLVLGHRGFSGGGVENTIPGLEAAAAAGADLVEMDVMQAADGGFVVIHDPTLGRLAGRDVAVRDLTVAELTEIPVHDRAGHTATIPTLHDYVVRAQELDMPLLIELKTGGADTADYVPRLLDELESLGAVTTNIFHSLDQPKIEELKRLRPDAIGGLILAVAGFDLPETTADFYVVEDASYDTALRDIAHDRGKMIFLWTVNDPSRIRLALRDEVDGIITDHPDVALASRAEIDEETGLAGSLIDAIDRFVTLV